MTSDIIKIDTAHWCQRQVHKSKIITLDRELDGCEDFGRRYAILSEPRQANFNWLQSLTDKEGCLAVFNLGEELPGYREDILRYAPVELKVLTTDDLIAINPVVKQRDKLVANMYSPIIINSQTRNATQLDLVGKLYRKKETYIVTNTAEAASKRQAKEQKQKAKNVESRLRFRFAGF